MKTFKEGDRVSHPIHGAGTVVHPYEGTGSTTVEFDSRRKIMTETDMLSPVPQATTVPFKNGDRVPDDAVEAACNHFWYDRDNGALFEDEVRGALNAALPLMLAALAESRQDTATGELFRFTLEQRQWLRGWGK